jgi:4-amino-4-deoxy-L-arabinose transferase-like glycosyltransferase
MARRSDTTTRLHSAAGWQLLLVLAVALSLRLSAVVCCPWVAGDTDGYDTLALNLINGHGFSWSDGPPYVPNLYRTPVYPVFLAAIYSVFAYPTNAVLVAQALLGTASCGLIYLIARNFWDHGVALLASVLTAVSPFIVYYTAVRLTETLHTFLMALGLYLLVCACRRASTTLTAASGGVLGMAALCRPEVAFFPVFVAFLAVVLRSRNQTSARALIAFLLSAHLVMLPWLLRNQSIDGRFGFLARGGAATGFWLSSLPYFSFDNFSVTPGFEGKDALLEEYLQDDEGRFATGERDAQMWRAGFDRIRADPWLYLRRRLRDYSHLWVPSGDYLLGTHNLSFSEAAAQGRLGLVTVKILLLLLTGLFPLSLALLGLWVCRQRLDQLLPLWAFPLYVTLTRIPFDIQPRLSLPAQPLMLTIAAAGTAWLWARLRRPTEYSRPVKAIRCGSIGRSGQPGG